MLWETLPNDVWGTIFWMLGPAGAQALSHTSHALRRAYEVFSVRRAKSLQRGIRLELQVKIPFKTVQTKVLGGAEGWVAELPSVDPVALSLDEIPAPFLFGNTPPQLLRLWCASRPTEQPQEIMLPRNIGPGHALRYSAIEDSIHLSPDNKLLLIESHPCSKALVVIDLETFRIRAVHGRHFKCAKFVGRGHCLMWVRAVYDGSLGSVVSTESFHSFCEGYSSRICSSAERAGALATSFRVYACDDIFRCPEDHCEHFNPNAHFLKEIRCREMFAGNELLCAQRSGDLFFPQIPKRGHRAVTLCDYGHGVALMSQREYVWVVDVATDRLLATGWSQDKWSLAASEASDQLRLVTIPKRRRSRGQEAEVVVVSSSEPGQAPWEVSWAVDIANYRDADVLLSRDASCITVMPSGTVAELPRILRAVDGVYIRGPTQWPDVGCRNSTVFSSDADCSLVIATARHRSKDGIVPKCSIFVYDTYSGKLCSRMTNEDECSLLISADRLWLHCKRATASGSSWLMRLPQG